MLGFTINEFFVNFVGENDDVFAEGDFAKGEKFCSGVDGPGWVAWGVDDDHLSCRGHGFLELLGSHFPTGRFLSLNDDGDAASEADHFWVRNPEWRGYDDFVAFLDNRKNGVVAGHFGTAGDANLAGIVVEVIVDLKFFGKGGAEFGNTAGRGVFGFAGLKSVDGSVLNELWGIDFRLTSSERVNFFALGDHCFGLCGDGQRE